jgi:hypothetical protein
MAYVSAFHGYRTPDLSEAAWLQLAGSTLADNVDPDFLMEAFYLYEWNGQYEQLEREITRLVYRELFYPPDRRSTAIRMSERIMEQQLSWADRLIPRLPTVPGPVRLSGSVLGEPSGGRGRGPYARSL